MSGAIMTIVYICDLSQVPACAQKTQLYNAMGHVAPSSLLGWLSYEIDALAPSLLCERRGIG